MLIMNDFSKEHLELIKALTLDGYYNFRLLPNYGLCCLKKYAFTTGLVIGLSKHSYFGRYCFTNEQEAMDSLKEWNGDGDPKGNWLKYKGIGGERENTNGGCLNCNLKSSKMS
jgi:hypothetical protein